MKKKQKGHSVDSDGTITQAIWAGLMEASGHSSEDRPYSCICPVGPDHSKHGKVQTKKALAKA